MDARPSLHPSRCIPDRQACVSCAPTNRDRDFPCCQFGVPAILSVTELPVILYTNFRFYVLMDRWDASVAVSESGLGGAVTVTSVVGYL